MIEIYSKGLDELLDLVQTVGTYKYEEVEKTVDITFFLFVSNEM